jgi:anti-sigma B factor antagonist
VAAVSSQFRFETSQDGDAATVRVFGDVDLLSADELQEAVTAAATPTHAVVVDMTEVEFIDSSGLNALVRAAAEIRDKGGSVRLGGMSEPVERIISVSGIAPLFA